MQHPMAGAGHIPAAVPLHPPPRREYGYPAHHPPYYHHQPPQSPIQPGYYYTHPPPAAYRWQPPYPQPHAYPPPPHMQAQYQPRSPMVVSSAPHVQPMTPVTRQPAQMAAPPQATQSPRPIPPYMQQQAPAASPSPAPAPAAAPKPEEPRPASRVETPAAQSARRPSIPQNPLLLPPEHKTPFWPQLPWYSDPKGPQTFPSRAPTRRRRRRNLRASNNAVALPTRERSSAEDEVQPESQAASAEEPPSETSTIAAPSEPETPATSQAPSESDFTQVSTPATPAQASTTSPKPTPTQQQHARRDTRTAIAVPHIPGLPKPKEASPPATVKQDTIKKSEEEKAPKVEEKQSAHVEAEQTPAAETVQEAPAPKPAPKSWADLVRSKPKPGAAASSHNGEPTTNGVQLPKSAPLADALKQYNVKSDLTLSFLEPRGLVNTGNMCYMNSILQVLVFCVPFYNFLDQVRQRTVHSMKSDTPLVDAMIMFMREFKVLASTESADQLRSRLKQEQLEEYGESVTPEYVYEVIRKVPKFAGMRRGQQQDAEEFLNILLDCIHDECVKVMQGQSEEKLQENGVTSPDTVMSPTSADGWQEVGPKQKAAVTRTAGHEETPSPITKIFGGYLRSEFRVPGLKDSVTLEPYKPLQLDIGSPQVNNIVDAMKGLTKTEAMTGEFGGRGTNAKKQMFVDSVPPVLIIHLKRFQYDNATSGTQKIWKKVGYPLELELPKEIFPPGKRNIIGAKKYRLTSVVYHHGKSAAGGHYTVDVLRQDSREWIRMDDTVIRRVRAEDVAEGGAEEDPKILAKALEQHKADSDMQKQRNMYQGLDEAEKEPEEEKPWSEVNGNTNGHAKKWSGAAITTNGTSTPTSTTGKRTPTAKKEGVRDNKVAYILLYEQIRD